MNQQINIIGQLPQSVTIFDLSFDWTGKRIAAACSDKNIRIYKKSAQGWNQQSMIKLFGTSVWKVKWGRPQLGIILITCSLDREISIYQWRKIKNNNSQINDWVIIQKLQENNKIQDFKFVPFKQFGFSLAVVTSDGYLKIIQPTDLNKPQKSWSSSASIKISDIGLSCLSWCKAILKDNNLLIGVGCMNEEDLPRKIISKELNQKIKQIKVQNTVQFVYLSKEKVIKKVQKKLIKQKKSINDISWALINGRSYNLLGICTQQGVKIFQIQNSNGYELQVLKQIKLSSNATFKINWNVMGTYLSVSQKKKIRIWRAQGRSNWKQIKQIQNS